MLGISNASYHSLDVILLKLFALASGPQPR
ncbi:Uncharacterised protein [Vibrio cholerae]|nr:Uncharacterised protein [Vibrio cholerae]